jgi:hypothetical protein
MAHIHQFVRDASRLSGGNAQRLMDAAEVIMHEIQRQRVPRALVKYSAFSTLGRLLAWEEPSAVSSWGQPLGCGQYARALVCETTER